MSKYTTYYNSRQKQFKALATQWKAWSDTAGLSKRQSKGMSIFFKQIGKRFGLIKEFKDIGVI
jgi:hypothetical protein